MSLDDLPAPPEGFSRREVEAFAERAIDIVERGISADVASMTPDAAFDYVMAEQYPESVELAARESRESAGDFDWQWAWASLFSKPPNGPARVLSARWQVGTSSGTLADGSSAPQLDLALTVVVENLITAPDSGAGATAGPGGRSSTELAPIVVKRTVLVRGFEPLGGQSWWPGIGVQTTPYLGGKCAPVNGSILTPSTDETILRRDLRELRKLIRRPQSIEAGASSDGESIKQYVQRYCEQR